MLCVAGQLGSRSPLLNLPPAAPPPPPSPSPACSGLLQQLDAAQGSADSTLAVRAEQVQKHIEDVLLEGQ